MIKSVMLPKILLVVGGDIQGKDAGEIFLRDIVKWLPPDRLVRYALVPALPPMANQIWGDYSAIMDVHPPQSLSLFKFRLMRAPLQILLHLVEFAFLIPLLANRIVKAAKELNADLIWVVTNSPQLIYLANRLIRNDAIRLAVTVWDPPERFIVDQKIPRPIQKVILDSFKNVMTNAAEISTASEGMKEEYKRIYNKDSVVLIHSIDNKHFVPPRRKLNSKSRLVIGFAGNLYASQEWLAFLAALNSTNWMLSNREVVLRLLGSFPPITEPNSGMNIQYMGWRNLQETIDVLAGCDLAYLPYWMDEENRYITRMCFPNKMSVYLAAGIPVFYHGPSDASPAVFMEKYRIGVKCCSRISRDIIDAIDESINNADGYAGMSAGIEQARQKELNLKTFQSRFAYFISPENYKIT